jgi:hypothetical protein
MPNGVDKNYRRLLMACAVYRQRFGEWPTQARLGAVYLHSLAYLFDLENFQRLTAHLELRTMDAEDISVGGRGVQFYSDVDHERLDHETLELARTWLGLEVRRDIEHW